MFPESINQHPADWLTLAGTVFAEFGEETQDSGNVSYGVMIGGERFFVKTAGDPGNARPYLNHAARVEYLRNAVRLYTSCPHRLLAKLLTVVESPLGPMLVYEWIDGELLYTPGAKRESSDSSLQRFRALSSSTIIRHLTDIYQLHVELEQVGWAPVDFYDGCLMYDFAADRLTVIDIDSYRLGESTNDMGRMFGSSRFMAPEEFAMGSPIDSRTSVFVMGRTALVLLSDGTLNPDALRGPVGLMTVLQRACCNDRGGRYATISAFHNAWTSVLLQMT